MAASEGHDIESVLSEARKFPPSSEFSGRAWIKNVEEYDALCRRAEQDPEKFWGECGDQLSWFKPYDKVLEWNFPSPNGSWAARSTPRTIASIVI